MFNMNQIQFAFCSLALSAPPASLRMKVWRANGMNYFSNPSAMILPGQQCTHETCFTPQRHVGCWSCFEDGPPLAFNESVAPTGDLESSREAAISHAAFGLLSHRFAQSPGADTMLPAYENKMISLGLDPTNDTLIGNSPAAVGNRIAQAYIQFGLADSSNEINDYENWCTNPSIQLCTQKIQATLTCCTPTGGNLWALRNSSINPAMLSRAGFPVFVPRMGCRSPILTSNQPTHYL